MELERYQDLARRTQNPELTLLDRRLHALHGLASEVGEIHGIYQKGFQGHPVRPEDVTDELGDLLWFAAELCDVLGVSLSSVAQRSVDKLTARYPEGFSEERSLNRDSASKRPDGESFAQRLRSLRKARGLTQGELADRAGVTTISVCRYENGKVDDVRRTTLRRIADALGVTVGELYPDM